MSKELDVAVEAAKAGSQILLQNYGKIVEVEAKSPKELVSAVDIASEEKILSILQRDFPGYGIWAEESGEQGKSDCRWIVDPLDGTHNFLYEIPIFGVSIALEKAGRIEAGVIMLPFYNELFAAERGKGAFLNGKQIHVSKRPIERAIVRLCHDFIAKPENAQAIKTIRESVLSIRSFGAACFALSALACGRIDASIEGNEKLGDFAAGLLLVEEAGGKFTKTNGQEFSLSDKSYLASNGIVHDRLVEIMGEMK